MTAPARSPRALAGVCAGLLVASASLWGAGVAVWYRVSPSGRGPVDLSGAQVSPALSGVALLALAGVAAVVATGGLLRRAVGLLLALAGAAVGVVAARGLLADPFATDGALPALPPGMSAEALRYQLTETTPAPWLAVAGALVLVAAGLHVAVRERGLARLGARYAAPGRRPREVDPDRAAWQDLDAGRDPTADAPARGVDDRGRDDPDDGR